MTPLVRTQVVDVEDLEGRAASGSPSRGVAAPASGIPPATGGGVVGPGVPTALVGGLPW